MRRVVEFITRSLADKTIYDAYGLLALVSTPIAPAFFFSWEVYTDVLARSPLLALPVALCAGASLETVGIFAGHAMVKFFISRRYIFSAISVIAMIIYSAIGIIELRETHGWIFFVIGAVVYVLYGLHTLGKLLDKEEAEAQKSAVLSQETKASEENLRLEREKAEETARLEREAQAHAEREAEERRLAHEERMLKIELAAKVKMAQAEARGRAKVTPKVLESLPKVSETSANGQEESYNHWRTLPDEVKVSLRGLSDKEIHARFPHLNPRTATNWRNNALKLSQNGNHL